MFLFLFAKVEFSHWIMDQRAGFHLSMNVSPIFATSVAD